MSEVDTLLRKTSIDNNVESAVALSVALKPVE